MEEDNVKIILFKEMYNEIRHRRDYTQRMFHCNKRCKEFVAKRPIEGGRYENGRKRCNVCDEYIIWDGMFCPCCGCKLRQQTRNSKFRDKFLTVKRI